MEKLIWLAVAGAAGALARYGVGVFVQDRTASGLPWGIFTANMAGSFIFGVLWSAFEQHGWISEQVRTAALIGFLGSFTTFSTFAFNNAQFVRAGNWQWLALNVGLSNALGIALVFAGFRLGKAF